MRTKREDFSLDLETYESMFHNIPDLVCIFGMDGYFRKINNRFTELFGYSESDFLTRPITDFIHPDDREKTLHEIKKMSSGIPVLSFENRYVDTKGQIRWLEWSCIQVPKKDYLFSIARDMTDMHESQETFVETILDNIPDMIFVKDSKDLRFVRFNKAGEELLGYSKADLLGKNDFDFFPEGQAIAFTTKDRAVLEGKIVVEIPEEPIETRLKGRRFLHTKKIPLLDSHGNPQYLIGISEDITEKRQMQEAKQRMYQEQFAREEVEKLLKARDEFISIASHELKSPLSALKLQAQMISRKIQRGDADSFDPEKMRHLVELTEKQVLRLDRLVNDMLDVSRIRSGKLTMEWSEFNICELVHDAIKRMGGEFNEGIGLQPQLICDDQEIIGCWDRMRIEQVIVNLFTNAIRYGGNKPVQVRIKKDHENMYLSVHDEGIGIKVEHREMIFDRFERAIEKNEVSGLGLGLFISKQIVEAHKGVIWVESEFGKFSTFYVKLPLRPVVS